MKRLYLSMIVILFLTFISACQSDNDTLTLDTPDIIGIDDSILTFSEVENASRYRIEVENIDDGVVRRYFITQSQDLNTLFFPPGEYLIKLQAVGDQSKYLDSNLSESVSYTQIDPFLVNILTEAFLLDPSTVNWFGRNHYTELTKTNQFYFTASGFEVRFYGTSLHAEFVTGANPDGKEPHLVILHNGETDPTKGTLLVLDKPRDTYALISGLPEGEHVIRVLKRSESIDSSTGLVKLETDGHFLSALPKRTRTIEVVAASSSAGFGNLAANTNEAKTTQNSDGLRAYAYLASRMLDAEINIFSASGWPLLKGPWTGENNIPNAYDFVNVYSSIAWNHTYYQPDVVVINLGTNDWSYITSLGGDQRAQAILNFEDAMVEFISKINYIHPDAVIIIAYGLMNETQIYTPTLNAVNKARTALPHVEIFDIELPSVNANDGIGSSNHPSLKTHIKAADVLAEAISDWLDWDIVRENISFN